MDDDKRLSRCCFYDIVESAAPDLNQVTKHHSVGTTWEGEGEEEGEGGWERERLVPMTY